jgi:hypothetical protein
MLLSVSLGWSQYYSHSSIRLDDAGNQHINFIKKDAWNQLIVGLDKSLLVYDGHSNRSVWKASDAEHLLAFYKPSHEHDHYILTDHNLYRTFRFRYDSIQIIYSFPSPIHTRLFCDHAVFVQDENHVVSKIDLHSGRKVELPYIGGEVSAFHYEDGQLYIFADQVYAWNENTNAYRETSLKIQMGNIQIISTENKTYLLAESGKLWLLNLSENIQEFTNRIPISSSIVDGNIVEDELYILTQHHGLIRYNVLTQDLQYLNKNSGLCQNSNTAYYLEDSRHIWTAHESVLCLTIDNYPVLADENRGLSDQRIVSTTVWNDELYFGSRGTGLNRLKGQRLKTDAIREGFIDTEIPTLFPWDENQMLIGTAGSGVARLDVEGNFHFIDSTIVGGRYITSMTSDVDNKIYVGSSDRGLWVAELDTLGAWIARRLQPSSLHAIVDLESLVNDEVIVAEINKISLLNQRKNRMRTLFSCQGIQQIRDIDIWNGWIYVVLTDEIIRLPLPGLGEQIEHFSKGHGLRSNSNYSIQISGDGMIISDDQGASMYPVDYFERPVLSQIIKTWPFQINKNTLIVYEGEQIVGTEQGLLQINKEMEPADQGRLILEEIRINDRAVDRDIYDELLSKESRWLFTYQSIHPEYRGDIHFQWRLEGKGQKFSGTTDQRSLYFPYLPPDQYTLTIQGQGNDFVTNTVILPFCIVPPWTSTKAFLTICLLGGLMLMGVIIWITSRIVARKTKKKLKQQQWEHEKLEWQQKALQLQMNPHFIFNALNSIQSLIGKDDKQARYYTAKLGKLMRMTLHHSRAKWIALNEEIELLQTYLELEKLNRPFYYSISKSNIENDIAIPPMMIQPIVENAVKHGVHAMLEKGQIDIKFYYEGRKIKCVVKDNGPGISDDKSDPEHISVSTRVINERMALYDKEGVKVDLIKLINRSQNGEQGTEVQIGLPYNEILKT